MSQRPRLHIYRWEAIYTADFTLDALRRRCWSIGAALTARSTSCLVTHDTRFLSGHFARYAYRALEAQGVGVAFCPTAVPFPAVELGLEQRRAECALIVSAGNRPHWFNGLIVLAPLAEPRLLDDVALPDDIAPVPFPPPPMEETGQTKIDLRTPYLELLRSMVDVELIRRSGLTVFVDPMNGSTSGYVPAVIGEGTQTKAIEINRESDPLFGRQPPQPIESGLVRLRKLVKESDSHLGVALSADGRAIGVTDNTGELVAPSDVALLLAHYLAQQYRQKGLIVVPRPADDGAGLRNWEKETGLKVEGANDPAGRIAELLAHDRNSLLAGTTAAGELTLGRYGASPDAMMAALLLIELTARSGGKLRAQYDNLRTWMSGRRT